MKLCNMRNLPTLAGAVVATLLTLAVAPTAAIAQPELIGTEFVANTYTTGPQRHAQVCTHGDGQFVVVWDDGRANYFGSNTGRDGSEIAVGGARFDARPQPLPLAGNDFVVNTYTTGRQDTPDVACLDDGGFVVVWTDRQAYFDPGQGRFGVFARRYNADGTAGGNEIEIESGQNFFGVPDEGAVCRGPNDGFVVVWNSIDPFESTDVRLYDSSGQPVGDVVALAAGNMPQCCGSSDGFVVTWWRGGVPDGKGPDVTAQRFDELGARIGTEFIVNTYTEHGQVSPAIACNASGEFVIAWSSIFNFASSPPTQDGDFSGIFGQAFDANGGRVGTEFRANTFTTGSQEGAAVAMDAAGRFVVSWTNLQYDDQGDDLDENVCAQAFDSGANPLGTELQVNTSTTYFAGDVSLDMAADGDFIVIWQTDAPTPADDEQIIGQRFSLPGAPTTTTITTTTVPGTGVCGDPIDPPTLAAATDPRVPLVTAADALFILQTAVGLSSCLLCVCDVDGSGAVTASDALIGLSFAVGLDVQLACPGC